MSYLLRCCFYPPGGTCGVHTCAHCVSMSFYGSCENKWVFGRGLKFFFIIFFWCTRVKRLCSGFGGFGVFRRFWGFSVFFDVLWVMGFLCFYFLFCGFLFFLFLYVYGVSVFFIFLFFIFFIFYFFIFIFFYLCS